MYARRNLGEIRYLVSAFSGGEATLKIGFAQRTGGRERSVIQRPNDRRASADDRTSTIIASDVTGSQAPLDRRGDARCHYYCLPISRRAIIIGNCRCAPPRMYADRDAAPTASTFLSVVYPRPAHADIARAALILNCITAVKQ